MKVILDIKDDVYLNMLDYSNEKGMKLETLIEDLFNVNVYRPIEYIEKQDPEHIKLFNHLLMHYLNEAIQQIERLSMSPEAEVTDDVMVEVFRELNVKQVNVARVKADLLQVFVNHIEEQ